tara:strand:+ start:1170 stop:2282 length:1113 start_codon:yes stop_codon:yes gene_type:complete
MKKNKNIIHNIDKTHSEYINEFETNENEIIPSLIKKRDLLKSNIKKLKNSQIDEVMNLKDEISEINQEIKTLKSKKKKYFLDNSKHLFNYFEGKKNISTGEVQNVNVLNSFFKIKNEEEFVEKQDISKISIINYWKNVNNDITNISDFITTSDQCMFCFEGEMIPQDDDGIIICNNPSCGKFITYIVDNSKPLNKEPPHEVSYTSYIRLNHFKEILSQFQAKETTQIPDQVIEDIRNRIKKERIQNISKELTYDKMREILRKLGYNKYFEHIQYINSIFGIRPPIMSEELHETLCVLFIEIQKPWAIHCPASRTNFFNYTYTLYQLCVLLDQTQYLPYIPLMKDREKQLEQDQIWKKVCEELDWQYYPTV